MPDLPMPAARRWLGQSGPDAPRRGGARARLARLWLVRLWLVPWLAIPLAACGANRNVSSATIPYDYRERHPIVIAEKPEVLDVAVTGRRSLDQRQAADVRAFAASYRQDGSRGIRVFVPAETMQEADVQATLRATRHELAGAGLRGANITVARYHPGDDSSIPVVRLSFMRLGASVAGPCGQWPDDLASGGSTSGWKNASYWNFGCATQANLAAQVADPLDFARPRQEGAIDTQKRLRGIGQLRQGKDPSTVYRAPQRLEDLGQ